ncbi:MAG: hypothetical protein LBV68_08430 [Spirochaetaceae bacterium]|jgi:hypothetical protein|nr:hypothetical protein [Spirochaetaceae bacterium]
MKVFYFTAIGNCLYAAKYLSDGNHYSIIQAAKSDTKNFEDDVIGFVFPTFAFCVPKIADKIPYCTFQAHNRCRPAYSNGN